MTRAREQASALSELLHSLGAEVIELPTIAIQPAADYEPLDRAIANLRTYDWLIFTSANGVRFFLERLDASKADLRAIGGRICAIGPATREALERFHLKVDVMAEQYVAEGLARRARGIRSRGCQCADRAGRGRARFATHRTCAARRAGGCGGSVSDGNAAGSPAACA